MYTTQSKRVRPLPTNHMPIAPTTLVLSSGGVRGVAHAGALQVLATMGWIGPAIQTVVGTSAGALVGMLVALRYTPDEVVRLVREYDFSTLCDAGVRMYPSNLLRLPRAFGAVDSAHAPLGAFVTTIVENSRVAGGDAGLSLGALHQRTGCALIVCATDTWTSRPVYFGPESHPDMPIVEAVRASCNIPFYFTPVDGRYVDGALVDHYPFARATDPVGQIVGVVIVDAEEDTSPVDPTPSKSLGDYVRRLVRAVETTGTQRTLADTDVEERSIVVRCARGMGEYVRREEYLEAGARAARAFVARQRALKVTARIGPTARDDITRVLQHKGFSQLPTREPDTKRGDDEK